MKFFKNLKEEAFAIPILLLIVELVRNIISIYFPDSALFDAPSEFETFVVKLWQFLWITCAVWLLIRIVFPKVYKYLRDEFYNEFNLYDDKEKRSIGLKVFFGFLFAFILLFTGGRAANSEQLLRKNLHDTLQSQLNVREATGKNDGLEVAKYLRSTGLGIGNPWCAAFCAYNLKAFDVPNPMSAYSPNFAKKKDIIWTPKSEAQGIATQPKTGDCFTLFYPNLNRVGHVGFVINRTGGYFVTIEGNTNSEGGREGNGVFKRKRDARKIHAITNYITPYIKSITHETNSIITAINYKYTDSLQSQNDSINRERKSYNQRFQSYGNKDLTQGFIFYKKSGQRIDKGYTHSQRWSNKHARNNSREYRSKSNSECSKQPTNCELFVQGIRNKIPSSNAHGELLAQTIFSERKSKNNHKNSLCEVHPSLG